MAKPITIIILICFVATTLSCSSKETVKEQETSKGQETSLVGKWQLVTDAGVHNTTIEFSSDGSFIAAGQTPEPLKGSYVVVDKGKLKMQMPWLDNRTEEWGYSISQNKLLRLKFPVQDPDQDWFDQTYMRIE